MRMTFPSFPLSSPRITFTVSPFETWSFSLLAFSACLACNRFFAVFLYFRTLTLQNLRGERDDLHVLLLAELARHGTEDTRRSRLARIVDDHDCVFVEADVGAVLAAGLLGGAHDDRARHV